MVIYKLQPKVSQALAQLVNKFTPDLIDFNNGLIHVTKSLTLTININNQKCGN